MNLYKINSLCTFVLEGGLVPIQLLRDLIAINFEDYIQGYLWLLLASCMLHC